MIHLTKFKYMHGSDRNNWRSVPPNGEGVRALEVGHCMHATRMYVLRNPLALRVLSAM